jgi:hypothetical protein
MLQQVVLPAALTHVHARAACTHPTLSIYVMRASGNSHMCTQRAVSAQTVEHSMVKKMHVCMQSARAGQHPTNVKPGTLALPGLIPYYRACSRVNTHRYACCAPSTLSH